MIRRIPDLLGKILPVGYVFCETSSEDAGQEVRIDSQCFTKKYSGVVNKVYWDKSRYLGIYVPPLFYGNSDRLRHAVCRTGRRLLVWCLILYIRRDLIWSTWDGA